MGQGTCKYRKIMRTPQSGENAGKKHPRCADGYPRLSEGAYP